MDMRLEVSVAPGDRVVVIVAGHAVDVTEEYRRWIASPAFLDRILYGRTVEPMKPLPLTKHSSRVDHSRHITREITTMLSPRREMYCETCDVVYDAGPLIAEVIRLVFAGG